jgi:hypothetical protein
VSLGALARMSTKAAASSAAKAYQSPPATRPSNGMLVPAGSQRTMGEDCTGPSCTAVLTGAVHEGMPAGRKVTTGAAAVGVGRAASAARDVDWGVERVRLSAA